MNQFEKIMSRYIIGGSGSSHAQRLCAGDFVRIRPEHIMSHDNTAAIIPKFRSLASPIHNPRQPVFAIDHDIQNKSNHTGKYSMIQAFAEEHGVDFFPAGRGIAHQVMVEEAYCLPGSMVVAPDSHSNMYGGIGCLGTPLTRTDAAVIWATSSTWWKIPRITRVKLSGKLQAGVTGKDLILTLCSAFPDNQVLNHIVEFSGTDSIMSLSIEDRLTIANMTTEWGCLGGLFPVDDMLMDWLKTRSRYLHDRGPAGVTSDRITSANSQYIHPRLNQRFLDRIAPSSINADQNAEYFQILEIDLNSVSPFVTGPNLTSVGAPVNDLESKNIPIQKAYLLSCVNARNSDLRQAAEIVRGKKVASGVEFYVAPASSEVRERAQADGSWQALEESGATFLPAGCGPCIGLGVGLLKDNEVGISATNRNFRGRMGSRSAECYLASPAIVAASAIAGKVASPYSTAVNGPVRVRSEPNRTERSPSKPALVNGFPLSLCGPMLFFDSDNINTDAIYPGKYTYRDNLSPDEMAAVAMSNFPTRIPISDGSVLIAGYNFGCGSSREQAATCLKHAGVKAVITASVNETYQRNAFNNGFLVLQSPELIHYLRQQHSVPPLEIDINFSTWTLTLMNQQHSVQSFAFDPVSEVGQQLIIDGGIEGSVRKRELRPNQAML